MARLSTSLSGELRLFAFLLANGTLMRDIDYLPLLGSDPSAVEMAFAVFANNIDMDDQGRVLNASHAQNRAAEYLRSYCDTSYFPQPPLEDWEVALY